MITQRFKAGAEYKGQKVLSVVEFFGKEYFFMKDGDGTIYLAKIDEDGNPDFS